MPRPIGEQVMVVAGASSGVGLATAREAARRGARVVLAARNTLDLAAAAEAIRREGGQAVAVPADVADYAQVEALASRAVEAFGRIDTWVTTAAVSAYATFREQPLEDFRRVLEVDFMGQVHCARAALPHLEQTGGALICIGSVLSDRGVPLQGAYCAAKHALKGWLDSLRMELRHTGSTVRVTLVKPSAMDTPLFEKAKTQTGVAPQPIPPVYQPELAVEVILRAAEGNERDAFVGGAGKLLSVAERISPRLVDLLQHQMGFLSQRGDRPKSADAPNNLYAPVEHDGGVRGVFGAKARRWSAYQALEAHAAAAALLGAGALAVAALAGRGATGRRLRPLLSTGAALLAGKSLLARTARG
ncbi:MAG TPA: SDR family oxidoreductase [Longimicrobium sp.]|nr:SDR family oxidoreductase [Longimicrobium sp.]